VKEVLDCGDEIGKWLDTFLEGNGYRLVYHALGRTQRTLTDLESKFPGFLPKDKVRIGQALNLQHVTSELFCVLQGSFQDQTSFMLMAEESVTNLNTRLSKPVTYKNFRPSILIHRSIPGDFAEDCWGYIRIGSEGGPIFRTSKPCTRCRLTTIDPSTGEFDGENEPLQTLVDMNRSFGDSVVDELVRERGTLGLQLGLYTGQEANSLKVLKVKDPVYVALL